MNSEEIVNNLESIQANLITSCYWGEPAADFSDVENLSFVRNILDQLGYQHTSRVGETVIPDHSTDTFVVIYDAEDYVRVYDMDRCKELNFDTEADFQKWLTTGEYDDNE